MNEYKAILLALLEDGQRQGSIGIFQIKLAIAAAHRVKEPGPITLLSEAAAAYVKMPNKGPMEVEAALGHMVEIVRSANCIDPSTAFHFEFELEFMRGQMRDKEAAEKAESDQDKERDRLDELRLAGAI